MSRKYSNVERFVWRDPEYRSLDLLTQHVWLHLLTSPLLTSIPGLIPASLTTIADEMGQSLSKGFRTSFDALVSLGWVKVDPVARLIYLPGAVKHNPPESLNVITGWGRSFHEIPDSPLKYEWLQGFIDFCNDNPGDKFNRPEAVSKAFAKAIESLSKGFRTPDPDPDPDPDPEPNHDPKPTPPMPPRGLMDGFEEFWSAYPRKIGKKAAARAYAAATDRPPLADILAAIEAQKGGDAWTRDGGAYIPHPATWLNQGRWADEVTAPRIEESRREREARLEREEGERWAARVAARYNPDGTRKTQEQIDAEALAAETEAEEQRREEARRGTDRDDTSGVDTDF